MWKYVPRPFISASYHPGRHRSRIISPVQVSMREPSLKKQLYSKNNIPYPRFWLLTEASMTSVSIAFFSICAPRVRAFVIRLSTRRGFPWEWLWTAERAAYSMMEAEPHAQEIPPGGKDHHEEAFLRSGRAVLKLAEPERKSLVELLIVKQLFYILFWR